ncbi:MAG TPA: hypothetical protein VL769_14640 [Acidimicrobiia bacterium]|nr:hypothetical protein [Acidimicrobiia bacterium]
MMKSSFARIPVLAFAVLVAGACGSAASPKASSSTSVPKLSLAKASARTGVSDAALAPGAMPVQLTNYVLDGTLPDLGTQAPVYRWTAHAVDLAEVDRLAAALGIQTPATATVDGFSASDSDATLTVTTNYGTTQISYYPGGNGAVDASGGGTSGGSSGSVSSPPSAGTGTAIAEPAPVDPGVVEVPPKLTAPVDVPNASTAEGIARELLDHMGVLDGQHWETVVTDSGGIAISCAVGEDCSGVPQQVTARNVSFTLVIDGVHVSGVGWNVTVGERSRIDAVYGEWGSAGVLGTYDLRSTADAFAALQKGDANFGGREPAKLADDVPVNAQAAPALGAPTPVDTTPVDPTPIVPSTVDTKPVDTTPVAPIDVHVTGVSLGIARWDAVDGNNNVVDLVPTYVFHTTVNGSASDVEELALDPAAIDFADPIVPPVPVPKGGSVKPEPAPAPDSRGSGSSTGSPTVTPGS